MSNASGGGSGGGSSGAIRAGAAFVELQAKDEGLQKGLKAAEKRVSRFASVANKLGGAIKLGLFAGGAAALGGGFALFKLIESAADRAKDVATLGAKLGIGTEKLSAFAYAAETTGVRLGDLEGHFENFAERVAEAAKGGGEAVEAFRRLGLNPVQLKGMDQIDQLLAVADAMAKIGNETERLGILSKFGGDQFQKLNELFKLGPAELRKRIGEGINLGSLVTKEDAESARAIERAFLRISTAVRSIGAALLPSKEIIDLIGRGVASVAVAIRHMVQNGASIAGSWLEPVRAAFGELKYVFEGIEKAVMGGNLNLAGEIIVAGLDVAWKKILEGFTRTWNTIKGVIVDGIYDVIRQVSLMLVKVITSDSMKPIMALLGVGEKDKDGKLQPLRFTKLQAGINNEFMAGQDARWDARQAAEDAASDAFKKALDRMRELTLEGLFTPDKGMAKAQQLFGKGDRLPAVIQQVGSATRGAFQSGNFTGLLAGDSGGLAGKQLKQQERGNNLLAQVVGLLKTARPLAWN